MAKESYTNQKLIVRGMLVTLLAVVGLDVAQAQLATDLDCSNCVGNEELGIAAVFKANIANATITGNKIAPEAIGTGKIKDNAITSGKLAGNSVGTGKLKDGAVTAAKLGDGAVTALKIGDGAVTAAKLGAGAVMAASLEDGAVTAAKLDPALPGAGLQLDGTELRSADGFVSVSARAAQGEVSMFETIADVQDGRTGRSGVTSATEFLVALVQLPHGATVTSFTYNVYDNDVIFDSTGQLVRDDQAVLASVGTTGNATTLMTVVDAEIDNAVVDNSMFSYAVLMEVHGQAGDNGRDIMPANVIIGYTF